MRLACGDFTFDARSLRDPKHGAVVAVSEREGPYTHGRAGPGESTRLRDRHGEHVAGERAPGAVDLLARVEVHARDELPRGLVAESPELPRAHLWKHLGHHRQRLSRPPCGRS